MAAWITYSVHGNAVVPERTAGNGPLMNTPGVDFSDVVGFPRRWGQTFRGGAGQADWFHYPLPTLDSPQHGVSTRGIVQLLLYFLARGTARMTDVHLWASNAPGGAVSETSGRIHAQSINAGGDRLSSPVVLLFNPVLPFNGPLGVSMLVNFGSSASDIVFRGATITFEVP